MISPGALGFPLHRPISRRRTPPYMRGGRRIRGARPAKKLAARVPEARDAEAVLLFHGPYELPVAMVRSPRPRARGLVRDLARWLLARWAWLRPRTIPVAVAFAGMLLFLAASDYLGELARGEAGQPAEPVAAHTLQLVGSDGALRVLELPAELPVIRLSR